MTTTTIISDGQITVPQEILTVLHIQTANTVDIETMPDGSLRIFPKTLKASDVAGMLKTDVHSTIEEMDEAIAQSFRKSSWWTLLCDSSVKRYTIIHKGKLFISSG